MTFKEKLAMEHPDCVDESDTCSMCPSCYGYESYDDSEKNCLSNDGKGCDYCWNREIPDEEKDGEHMKMNTFSKSDLKDGMVVEYGNGKRRLVLNNYMIGKDGYYTLDHYKENMKDKEFSDNDIMRVFTISSVTTLDRIFHIENLNLIWERKETKKMTVEEMQNKLEELTGEKIEVELSNEKKYVKILQHCESTSCSKCCLSNFGYCTWEDDLTNTKNVEDCYTKMMEQKE